MYTLLTIFPRFHILFIGVLFVVRIVGVFKVVFREV